LNELWLVQMAASRFGQNGNDFIHLVYILNVKLWESSDQ